MEFFPPKFHINVAQKSDSLSVQFRNIGNNLFKLNIFNQSLINYNKAITYGVSKEVMSLAYANRSAVYFELRLYNECTKNIQLARENGYPKNKMYKLNEREKKCHNSTNNTFIYDSNIMNMFKLSYPASTTIPFIAECIEFDKSSQKIITNRDLKAGDVISLEDPVIHFLRNDALYKRCSNCYESRLMNLFPCNRTASMMFCSTLCMDNFYSKALNIDEILCDDVKLLSEMSAAFGGIDEFKAFMAKSSSANLKNQTIFDFDFKDPDYNKNRMKCVLALSKEYSYSVDEKTCHSQKYVPKKVSDKILSILMPNLPRLSSMYQLNPQEEAIIPIFASILKQSCLPNVNTFSICNKVATIVIKPIKKGEELLYSHFNSYGFALKDHPHEAATIFNFKCKCQVCLDENYTFFPQLKFPILIQVSAAEAIAYIKEAYGCINKKPRSAYELMFYTDKMSFSLWQIAIFYEFPLDKTKAVSIVKF